MFLTSDIVKKGSKRYIVTGVDDSDPKHILYTCIRDTLDNRRFILHGMLNHPDVSSAINVPYETFKASELKFVEAL